MRLFRMRPEQARDFVASLPRLVKRRVRADQVEQYERALREIGAEIQWRRSPIEPARVIAVVGAPQHMREDPAQADGHTLTLNMPLTAADENGAAPEPYLSAAAVPPLMPARSGTLVMSGAEPAQPAAAPPRRPPPPPPPQSRHSPALPPTGQAPPAAPAPPSPRSIRPAPELATRHGFDAPAATNAGVPALASRPQDRTLPLGSVTYDGAALQRTAAELPWVDNGRSEWLVDDAQQAAGPRHLPAAADPPASRPVPEVSDVAARPEPARSPPATRGAEPALQPGSAAPVPPSAPAPGAADASSVEALVAGVPASRAAALSRPARPGARDGLPPTAAKPPSTSKRPAQRSGRAPAGRPAAAPRSIRPPAERPTPVTAAPATARPALGPLSVVGLALALALDGAALFLIARGLQHAHASAASGTPVAAAAPGAPASAPSAYREPAEAPAESAATVWALSEFHQFSNGDKSRTRAFIRRLEEQGARAVTASGIAERGGVAVATELRIDLPADRAARMRIYDAIRNFQVYASSSLLLGVVQADADPFLGRDFVVVQLS